MSRVLNFLNISTDHFSNLYALANNLVSVLANETVTANSIAGGAMTVGNGFVSGIFGANTITTTTLRGGNVGTTTAVALGANLTGTGFRLQVGNVAVNDTVLAVGANIIANTISYWAGNTIANLTITATSIVVANASGQTSITPTTFFSGNSTVNAFSNSTVDVIANATSQAVFTQGSLLIGNSLANSLVNSTAVVSPSGIFGGASASVANASGFFFNNVQVTGGGGGGTPGGANATIQYSNNAAFAGSSNLTYNWTTTVLAIGAGTGVTINSSAFSGTANNALNLGGTVASGYQTAAGLSANVILLTANNANFLGGVAAAGYQTGAGLAANVLTLTANNATNFGGLPPSSYLSTAGLAANVLTMTSNNTLFHVSGQTNINSTSWGIGNTIANTTVNSTIIAVSSPGVNTQVNTTAMSFGISAISPVTISSTGAVPQVIDAFPLATYRAAEYLISIKDNNANNYQLSKILLLHTGGDAILTSYGTLISNTDLGGFTASANATAAALTFNPTSASTVLKINRILIAV